jgi:flagellar biosynthetic protein FlhB
MLMLNWYGNGVVAALHALMKELLSIEWIASGTETISPTVLSALIRIGLAMAPLLIGIVIAAILVNLVQVGLFFSPKRLQPRVEALNPFKGLGRLLGRGNGFAALAMNLVKLSLVGYVAYGAINARMGMILKAQELSYLQIFVLAGSILYSIAIRIGLVLLILAIIDYAYQRWRNERQLKMTKQEVKDEMRRMEGDPQIKQRRRQIAMQIAHQRLKKDVPTADVIVTNPTEFAVALKYDQGAMHAPRLIAKGQGLMAKRIREIAIANGVPILERKPLARALFKLVEVGQEIPEQFYSAVAEILAYVYELSGRARPRQAV